MGSMNIVYVGVCACHVGMHVHVHVSVCVCLCVTKMADASYRAPNSYC